MHKNKLIAFLLTLGLTFSTVAGFGVSASAAPGDSPLSGLPGGEGRPVVMVKYGNSRPDRRTTASIKLIFSTSKKLNGV